MTLGLTLDRLLRTTPERLYAVWTDPVHLTKWFGVRVDADPKVGGALAIHFWADKKPPLTGRYTDLNPYDLVGFTWMDGETETMVKVSFQREGEMTRLTLRHDGFLSTKSLADHEEGWFEYMELWAIRHNVGPQDELRASASGFVPESVDVRAALADWLGKDAARLDVTSQGDGAQLFKNGQIAAHWRPSKHGTSLTLTQWGFATEEARLAARDTLLARFTAWGGKA